MRLLPLHAILLLLSVGTAAAEDLPDPWTACSPRESITALAHLRAPLDARPDDQDLLGRAIMAYVNLALGGEPGLDGACGPWLDYARELAARRAKARGGEPASLADAAPELWVRLLDGDAVGTRAALERWADQRDDPRHRALAARTTRDVRPFRERPPTTEHERFASMVATVGAGMQTSERELPGFDPLLMGYLRMRAHGPFDARACIRAVYADVAWMLRSVEIDDATAIADARALIAGFGGADPAAAADRPALIAQAIQAAGRVRSPILRPQALAAAVDTVRGCLGAHRGVMDGTRHRLVGLGDVAAWNRDRLYLAGWFHVFMAPEPEEFTRSFVVPLRAALPGSLIVARVAAGGGDDVPGGILDALAEAIRRECADPLGVSPGLIVKPFLFLAQRDARRAAGVAEALIAARTARGVPARTGLSDLAEACRFAGVPDLVAAEVVAAVRRDPWYVALRDDARRGDPARPLLRDLPPPAANLVHAQVDFAELPFPGVVRREEFALRWCGRLRASTPGTYRLGTDSDDGSRLSVAGAVVVNDGFHAMQVRSATVHLDAGWHPLELEFFQGGGGAGVRLLWQPPGSERLVAIPASALAHGDDLQPGLAAELFLPTDGVRRLCGPDAAEIAEAETMPWLPRVQAELGQRLAESGRPREAVAAFDRIPAVRPLWDQEKSQRILALLDLGPAEAPRAIAEVWANIDLHQWFLDRIGNRLRRLGLQEAALAAMPVGLRASGAGAYFQGRIAYDCADFAGAATAWERWLANPASGEDRDTLHTALLEKAVIDRIGAATSPDLRELLARFEREDAKTCYRIAGAWLAGELAWDAALARSSDVEWGDLLVYVRGLHRLTLGEHDGARADLARIVADHPDWNERATCEGLLRWIARQTPAGLAAMPRAPAIAPRTAEARSQDPVIPVAPGAVGSDF